MCRDGMEKELVVTCTKSQVQNSALDVVIRLTSLTTQFRQQLIYKMIQYITCFLLELIATVEPLYCGHLGDLVKCPYREVPSFQEPLHCGHLGDLVKCPV